MKPMMMGFVWAAAVAAPALSARGQDFEGCGTLVQGVECVLFEADEGGQWVLDELGEFRVGDRVFVVGFIERGCFTLCQQGEGCIHRNTIEPCEEVECDAIRRVRAKCRPAGPAYRLEVTVKSRLEGGTELTLVLDGDRTLVVVTNRRGKAKGSFVAGPGRHEVCVKECPERCGSTVCEG